MPIDIATGDVQLARDDFELPGRVALKWTRRYRTALLKTYAPLAPGWVASLFSSLKRVGKDWHFTTSEGDVQVFADPEGKIDGGQTIRLLGAFLELARHEHRFIVTQWDPDSQKLQRFVFAAERTGGALTLVSIEDVSGDGLDLIWDSSGRLTTLRQRIENRTVTLNYSPAGQISSLALLTGRGAQTPLVRYEYDSGGRLSAAFDRRELANRYEYDTHSRVVRETLKDGAVYFYKYDEKDRCIHFSGLDHYNEKHLQFLDAANRTVVKNSYGNATIFELTPGGQITAEVDPAGHQRRTEFDEFGRIVAKIDPVGAITRYTYDPNGNRDSVTDPLGNTYRLTFNAQHLPLSVTDPLGKTWFRDYDTKHRLVATRDPLGARWTTEYDEAGNPVSLIDPLGSRRGKRFVDGMLVERTDWMGHVTGFRWDEFGRVTERLGPLGERTAISYDPVGNPVVVELPNGEQLRASYDAGDNLTSFANAKGHTTRLRFGSCNRLLECVDPMGRTIRFVWGSEPQRLDALINEKGERLSFSRNEVGRVVREVSFDGREQFFDFDAAGRRVALTNGNGERIQFQYDAAGCLTEQTLPDGTATRYEYDAVGRIVSAVNQDVAAAFEYDASGRLAKEWQGEAWVSTEYNTAGDVTRVQTSLGHEVLYELDPNGRPRKLLTGNKHSLAFERDAHGRETGRQMPGGLRIEQRFDSMGRMLEQRAGRAVSVPGRQAIGVEAHIPAGDELVKRDYSYDPDSLLVSIRDGRWGMANYSYDPTERILRAMRDRGVNESFEYDLTDNVVRMRQGPEARDTSCTYGAGNRLLRCGDTRYEYDPDGRLSRKTELNGSDHTKVWEYTWDAQGQLRRVRRPDGEAWEYKYDAFGRRVAKRGPKSACQFIWSGDVVIHEKRDDGQPVTWLMKRGSLAPLAKIQEGEFFAIVNDHLGTPHEMFDPSGRLVWAASYDTWGCIERTQPSLRANDCPIRFQGQWFDEESGLHYNRFRYYDPACGRFIQQDPVKLLGAPNFYSYPNPANAIDPLGLAECHESGERGRAKAKEDLKKAGFTIVDEEVTMVVGGERIRADFVAEGPNGRVYVFEVKNGTGGLTPAQEASGVFNYDNPVNQNGTIRTAGGSDPPGRQGSFEVDTGRTTAVGDRGDTGTATFGVIKYDGTPGSRVK
jgi:RHS repeat-associated protein